LAVAGVKSYVNDTNFVGWCVLRTLKASKYTCALYKMALSGGVYFENKLIKLTYLYTGLVKYKYISIVHK